MCAAEDGGDGGDAGGEAFAVERGGDLVGGELVGGAEFEHALGAQGAGVGGGGGLGRARGRVVLRIVDRLRGEASAWGPLGTTTENEDHPLLVDPQQAQVGVL